MAKEPEYFSQQVTDARRWFLSFPTATDKGIVTVSVGCERCLPEYLVQRDDFEFECMEFVAEGEGEVELNGKTFKLYPGTAFSYGPGIRHRIRNTGERPMVKYFLDCGGKHAKRQFANCSAGGGRQVQVGAIDEVAELYELLIRNAQTESRQSDRICAYLVETLLHKITEQTIAGGRADARAWATYDRIRQHIQIHYLRLKTMTELADEVAVDPAYLSRVFKRFHHLTPYQYLMRMKMRHAAALLLNPQTLVKEVAEELAFSDPFHFSRSFKSVYGMSPEQFMNRTARPGRS